MSDTGVGRQLRGWDAATFRAASGDPTMRSTVVAMAVFDRPPEWMRLRARLERLTLLVPQLRMRPLYGALNLTAPRLAVDPDFDLDVHVRRYSLPEGSGWQGLMDDARRMSLLDFDPNRPLWELALVEGLPDGQAAVLLKLHHAIADGQATVMIGLSLFEFTREGNPDEAPAPEPPVAEEPSLRDVTIANTIDQARRVLDLGQEAARAAVGLLRGLATDAQGTLERAASTLASVGRATAVPDGPLSPIMAGRGTTYRFTGLALPFAGLRAAAKREGMSVNDAFMAAIADGLDAYHRRHGVVVDELRVNVPIALRGDAGDRTGRASNAVAIARFPLPVAGLTSLERMRAAHDLVERWRQEPAMRLADPLAEVSWLVPVPMLAQAARASDVTASNVPGPPVPLYLCGAQMVTVYPLVATIGAAVNITMVTYDGTAYLGISADDRAVPDLQALADDLREGIGRVTGEHVRAFGEPAGEPADERS